MPNTFSLIGLALVLTSCQRFRSAQPGLRFPPYPPGVEEASGNLIQDTVGGTDYAVDLVSTPHGPRLWFSRLLSRDSLGHPIWELVDTLPVPRYDSTERLVIAGCSSGGQVDLEIVALAHEELAESLHTIVAAWRADRRSERFRPIPATGIVCENEGYGAD